MIQRIGERWNRLEIISFDKKKGHHYYWNCKCNCGTIKSIRYSHLISGNIMSCGCLIKEITSKRSLTHGHSAGGKRTSEYKSWESMIGRCTNIKATGFEKYGGRGITVCDRWLESFENFIDDMGNKPFESYSIERKDNNGNYEYTNCIWASPLTQANNRSNNIKVIDTISNKTYPSIDVAAREINMNKYTLHDQLKGKVKNKTNLKIINNDSKNN
jgi:hypothetical protein